MTTANIFNIILKCIGLMLLMYFFVNIPGLAMMHEFMGDMPLHTGFTFAFIAIMYFLVLYFLLFKTHVIIRILRLDQGFNDSALATGLTTAEISSILAWIIGLYLIITAITAIPTAFIQLNKIRREIGVVYGEFYLPVILAITRLIMGIWLLLRRGPIGRWLARG